MSRNQAGPQGSDRRSSNWRVCYHNKSDPRVIVPRRWKWMGWTLNFAHPSAIPVALLLIGACLGIPLVIAAATGGGTAATLIAGASGIAMLCLICASLSSPPG